MLHFHSYVTCKLKKCVLWEMNCFSRLDELLLGSAEFLFVVFEGVCPYGDDWTSFQSRCLYHPRSLKLSISKAMAACRREGAELLNNVYTEVQRFQIAVHLGDVIHFKKNAVWTGIKDHSYQVNGRGKGVKFFVKPCGSNATLLYNGNLPKPPSCGSSHLFMCEIPRGK